MFCSLPAKIDAARLYCLANMLKGTQIIPQFSSGTLEGVIISALSEFVSSRSIGSKSYFDWEIMKFFQCGLLLCLVFL